MIGNDPALHQISRGPKAVSTALDLVASFAAEGPAVSADILAIVVEELVCNWIDHGMDDRDGWLGLALWRTPNGVRIRLTDGCRPFEPRDAPIADSPPDRGGGAGLALVAAWTERLSYRRCGGRNVLDLLIAR